MSDFSNLALNPTFQQRAIPDYATNEVPRAIRALPYAFLRPDLTQTKDETIYEGQFDTSVNSPYFQNLKVLDNVVLVAPSYRVPQYNKDKKAYEFATIPESRITLNTVLVDITQVTNVVMTPIQGRPGTVKEYIAAEDWQLSVRGILVNHVEDKKPQGEVQLLVKILTAPVSLQIINDYINSSFGVNNITVTQKTFPQEEGKSNSQIFNFEAMSDAPVELTNYKLA